MNGFPFGQNPQNGGIPFIAFDPMAGFKADEKMADNVTAGEVSKFVGKIQTTLCVFSVQS